MKPEVCEAFCDFTDRFEGKLPFMYTDSVGLVTTGRGNLIDGGARRNVVNDPLGMTGPQPALALPWRYADGSIAPARDIQMAWWAVKNAWPKVQSNHCGYLTTMRLTDGAIDQLTFSVLSQMWHEAAERFKAIESWPACAQLGVMSMAWAMGGAFEAGFPKFCAAADAQDWTTCAVECRMTKPPVPEARNDANVKLFLGARRALDIHAALAT